MGFDPDVWHGRKAMAPVIGTARMIEPGVEVYSRTVRDDDDYPVGGIAIEHADRVDPETGEVTRRWLVVQRVDANRGQVRWHWIDEHDIDPESAQVAGHGRCTSLARNIAAAISHKSAHKRRTGPLSPQERDWARWAYVLMTVVMP